MPTTTHVQRERRRGRVGLLLALNMTPNQIAEKLHVAPNTILNDRRIIQGRAHELSSEDAVSRLRGVAGRLLGHLQEHIEVATHIEKEPKRVKAERTAIRAFWSIYRDYVAMEQAFGMMPEEPEKVDIHLDVGENVLALLTAVSVRMGMDEADELKRTLEVIRAEEPGLLNALGLHP